MAQDVAQWLAEIKALQQQVAELTQERDRAYASADNLRNMYEAEAKQRQREAIAAQRKIEKLKQTVIALQSPDEATSTGELSGRLKSNITAIESNRSVESLQTQLVESKKRCEHLKGLFEAEQAEHAKTRQSMTAALGDAVDLLAKERQQLAQSSDH
ncbi:MAG: hypothetical protein AAF703_00295 [Cyanobacteria bacterium P01_D01_bin.105]